MDAGVDGVDDGSAEELEVGLGGPVVLDGLEFGPVLAGLFGGEHELRERLEGGVCAAEDVGVVTGVDGGADEGGGFGVGSGNGEEVGAWLSVSDGGMDRNSKKKAQRE